MSLSLQNIAKKKGDGDWLDNLGEIAKVALPIAAGVLMTGALTPLLTSAVSGTAAAGSGAGLAAGGSVVPGLAGGGATTAGLASGSAVPSLTAGGSAASSGLAAGGSMAPANLLAGTAVPAAQAAVPMGGGSVAPGFMGQLAANTGAGTGGSMAQGGVAAMMPQDVQQPAKQAVPMAQPVAAGRAKQLAEEHSARYNELAMAAFTQGSQLGQARREGGTRRAAVSYDSAIRGLV